MREDSGWEATLEKLTIYAQNRILRYRALQSAAGEAATPADKSNDAELAKRLALGAFDRVLRSDYPWDRADAGLISVLKQDVDRELEELFGAEKASSDKLLDSISSSLAGQDELSSIFEDIKAGKQAEQIARDRGLELRRVHELIRELKRRVERFRVSN